MKVFFQTYGCRMNQSETAVLESSFKGHGFHVIPSKTSADIVVINTCTVTEKGDLDTKKLVNQLVREKPGVQIALIGCQCETQFANLKEMKGVRWIVGNAEKLNLAEIIQKSFESKNEPLITVPKITQKPFTIPISGLDTKHTRANIKIQDGCDSFCTYCEVPYVRGLPRSRVFENILEETQALAASGYKEVILTGINLGKYNHDGKNILSVIKEIENISDIRRVRISSLEPLTVDQDFFHYMFKSLKLCHYLHTPAQSCNNEILKRMKRYYLFEDFKRFVLEAHNAVPDLCIGTDVIVGFPGETDEMFQDTYEKLASLPLAYFHVFSYSKRLKAASRLLKEEISEKIIKERSYKLRQLSAQKKEKFFQSMIGKTEPVLFEQKKHGLWIGLTSQYVRVMVESEQNLRNEIISVKLKSIAGQTMLGQLI